MVEQHHLGYRRIEGFTLLLILDAPLLPKIWGRIEMDSHEISSGTLDALFEHKQANLLAAADQVADHLPAHRRLTNTRTRSQDNKFALSDTEQLLIQRGPWIWGGVIRVILVDGIPQVRTQDNTIRPVSLGTIDSVDNSLAFACGVGLVGILETNNGSDLGLARSKQHGAFTGSLSPRLVVIKHDHDRVELL